MRIKRGDTYPPLQAALKDASGTALNLTGATVTLSVRGPGGVTVNKAPVSIVGATTGQILYSWNANDTAQAGEYQLEFKVTFGDGRVLHVPNNTHELLEILPSIN